MLQSQIIARLQSRERVIKLAIKVVGALILVALVRDFALNYMLPC